MSITDRVQDILDTQQHQREQSEELDKFRAFYDELLKAGIAKKPTYTLPSLDTVGRQIYQQMAQQKRK